MSNALAIATVTAVLQDILHTALIDAAAGEAVDGAEVLTAVPTTDTTVIPGGPKINVYLYQVTPNAALRNAELPGKPEAVALDLHYLLSFYGSESALEPQRLLGLAVRALAANALVSRAAIDNLIKGISTTDPRKFLRGSDLSKAVELIKFSPAALTLEEMSRVWSVFFQTRYTLSVAYQCSVVVIDAATPRRIGLPVLERRIDVTPFVAPAVAPAPAAAPTIRSFARARPAPGTTLLTITFDPKIATSQSATLVLREDRKDAKNRLFASPPRDAEVSSITFTTGEEVADGKYVVSLVVDRAESPTFSVVLP